ncbi:hypothetical protein QL285_077809 [Trifolium repens]|jgi:hypothetical protein|nr:hypothetical protein QL285_077809 [Trifolium repens]
MDTGEGGIFTVNSTYIPLSDQVVIYRYNSIPAQSEAEVFRLIWMSKGPTKMTAFVWQFLLNKIPTRYNIQQRGMTLPVQSRECVLCDSEVENSVHLFLHCSFAARVWYDVFKWLRMVLIIPPDVSTLMNYIYKWFRFWESDEEVITASMEHGAVVFMASSQSRDFEVPTDDHKELVEEIKVLLWLWFLSDVYYING